VAGDLHGIHPLSGSVIVSVDSSKSASSSSRLPALLE
jgi:hypothetical protein